jgi:hypothetical protein
MDLNDHILTVRQVATIYTFLSMMTKLIHIDKYNDHSCILLQWIYSHAPDIYPFGNNNMDL